MTHAKSRYSTYLFWSLFTIMATSKANDLQILSVSPKGLVQSVSESQSIIATFDRPMVPLQATPEDLGEGPLTVRPAVPGKYRWLGTSTLSFTPLDTLPLSSQFAVTIPAGIKATDGSTLPTAFTWTFETLRPELRASYPAAGQEPVDLQPTILLKFNQPMSPQRVGNKIRLESQQSKESIPLKFTLPLVSELEKYWNLGIDSTMVIKAVPERKLNRDTAYRLTLDKGLLAAEGDLGMAKAKIIDLRTFAPLKYIGCQAPGQKGEEMGLDPSRGIELQFTNRVKPAELAAKIRFEPEIKIPEYYLQREWGQERIYLEVELKPETGYRLFLPADLHDVFGNQLEEVVVDSFRTGSYLPRVIMTSGPGVLESFGDRRYPIFFVNQEQVRLRMGMVPMNRLIPFLDEKNNLFGRRAALPDSLFMVDRLWEVKGARNRKIIRPIELDWLLAGKKHGLALIEVDDLTAARSKVEESLPQEESEAERDHRESGKHRALLQVTDLGISAKFSAHNNLVWVTSLRSAAPVAGAKIEIRDDHNRSLWSGVTDKDGMVETPGWHELGIPSASEWEKPRQWVFASKDGDLAYTASDWGTGIYPYRFGIDYDWNPEPTVMTGSLFTERGLYRAGETVHVKGILRERKYDRWAVPHGKEITLNVRDARGDQILQQKVTVSEFGSFSLDLPLQETAPLGYYSISAETLRVSTDPQSAVSFLYGNFRVEAFRPAEFTVQVRPQRSEYVLGDSAVAHIHSAYLFGSPLKGQKISWHYYIYPKEYAPPGRDDFFFGYPLWERESPPLTSHVLGQGRGHLDANGGFRAAAKLVAAEVDFALNLSISADVEGPNRQHIAGAENLLLHPAEFYVGIKQATTFAQAGKEFGYQIISVLPNGEISPNRTVEIKVLKRQWHSVRKAGIGGRYEWISKKVDTVIDSATVLTAATPLTRLFVPKDAGVYVLRASARDDRGNRTTTESYFYAIGQGYVAWEREDDDRVDLVPNTTQYRPGDIARIMVKSPFESAEALVTLEREGILSHQTLKLMGSTPTLEIPITETHLPNVFVSVILLKGRSANHVYSAEGEDVGRPAFKIGYTNLPVDPGSQHLLVKLESDKETYQPGDQVTATLAVTDNNGSPVTGEATLAVVDLGVLNLIRYELPDPFDDFYGQRPLSVQTSETRLHVVEQRNYGEKGENRGGGGGEGALDFGVRKTFKSTAYWNPSILLDANGRATVTFKLPDNLTTFKLMAVAQTKDAKFGRGSAQLKVSKPLLMLAALPRFARLGDRFEAGVVVHNYSGQSGKGEVSVEAEGIKLLGKNSQQVKLDDGESREVRFGFAAQSMGKSTLQFRLRLGDLTDGLEKVVPIYASRKKETVALYQRTETTAVETVEVPQRAFRDLTTLEITAASSAMTELQGPARYLFEYPYDCLEQKISRILPMLVAGELIKAFNLKIGQQGDFQQAVGKVLADLAKFQTDDGGFALWMGERRSVPYVSAYAAYALTLGRQKGYSIDATLLQSALEYLRKVLTEKDYRLGHPYDTFSWKATDAFILYVLALNGKADAGYVEKYFAERESLPVVGRAYLLKTLLLVKPKDERAAIMRQELINLVKVSPTTAHFEETVAGEMPWIFHSNVRTTAVVLQTLLETDAEFPLAERVVVWLLERRRDGAWMNTQENFYVLYALATYFQKYEKAEPNFQALVKMAGKEVLECSFSGRKMHIEKKEMVLDETGPVQLPIEISKRGQGQLYYGLRMSYYPLDPSEPREEGMVIIKSMQLAESTRPFTGSFAGGELVKVTLQVVAPMERNFVVADDPLPAGLEPVNLAFATTAAAPEGLIDQEQGWQSGFNHVEMHDDRVLLFADWLTPGLHTYSYLARAITKGTFSMPATYAEEMYRPEVYGRTVDKEVEVE